MPARKIPVDDQFLSVGSAAAILGISRTGLVQLAHRGILPLVARLPPNGTRIFSVRDVADLLEHRTRTGKWPEPEAEGAPRG